MATHTHRSCLIACVTTMAIASAGHANEIAVFADPMPDGGGATLFKYIQGSHGLYGGWAGPPFINLQTPQGDFTDCTMHVWPMFMYPDGRVVGGNITISNNGQNILQFIFTNGFADVDGLRCGPQTGGVVEFTFFEGGVQVPPGLSVPLDGAWFEFAFHNRIQGPRGPEWTASFSCGAIGRTGDLNCDGQFDAADIDPFLAALGDPAAYAAQHPFCDAMNGDINSDGAFDAADIDPFFALLGG